MTALYLRSKYQHIACQNMLVKHNDSKLYLVHDIWPTIRQSLVLKGE